MIRAGAHLPEQVVRLELHRRAQVAGVVTDAIWAEISQSTMPHVWRPFAQHYSPEMTVHVRTMSDPRPLLAAIREEVRNLDPELPVVGLELMEDVVDDASLAATLSRGARELSTEFAWDGIAARHTQLYQRLVGSGGPT